jgi:hypothetical protein
MILGDEQIPGLAEADCGSMVVMSYGMGVDSKASLVMGTVRHSASLAAMPGGADRAAIKPYGNCQPPTISRQGKAVAKIVEAAPGHGQTICPADGFASVDIIAGVE